MVPSADELVRSHKERGAGLLAKGKLEAALAEYEAAVEAAPKDVAARRKAAEILVRLGRIQDGVRAWQLLAGRLAADGMLVQAIAACKVVLQLEPTHQETQATLARLYAKQGVSTAQEKVERVRLPDSMGGGSAPTAPAPTPLFSELPEEVMRALLERLALISVNAGETIVTEGQTGRSLFVIASGSVEVVRTLPSGERKVLDRMQEGAFFGEIGLVADVPRLASIVAAEDCVVLEVTRELIAQLSRKFPFLDALVRGFYKERLLANLLRQSPVFLPLSDAERRAVAEKFKLRSAEAGEALLKQGEPGKGLFLLLRGRCSVSYRDLSGAMHTLPEMGEGAVMGEISLMTGSPVTATVTALVRSVLLYLDPATFVESVMSNEGARAMITKLGAERQQRTDAIDEGTIGSALL